VKSQQIAAKYWSNQPVAIWMEAEMKP